MNADAFRHFYNYHFAENRKIWDTQVMSLTQEQFVLPVEYSVGSIRNQVVHMMHIDNLWFSDLRGVELLHPFNPEDFNERDKIRQQCDEVEATMREYLNALTDEMLFQKPFAEGEDKEFILWQVLLHVGNHGTDHRAQLLRLLHDVGIKTESQDYFFYIHENL